MMAIRLEPNARTMVSLYDRREPGLRLSRKTLVAFAAVAALYAVLGALVMSQKIEILTTPFSEPKHITLTPWIPQKDPPRPSIEKTVPPTAIRAPVATDTSIPTEPIPVAPTQTAPADSGPITTFPTEIGSSAALEPTPVPTPGPSMIRNPNWVAKPSAAQLGRIYPDRAAERGVSGSATLLCGVSASGTMVGCTVIDETPTGWRFGEAALAGSKFFRMSPRTVDGQAVEGAKVRIPIVFNIGG